MNGVYDELLYRKGIIGVAEFESLQVKLAQSTILYLSGIDILHPKSNHWQGRIGVKNGLVYGLEEADIPNDRFDVAVLESGSLRRLVLQSDSTHDMFLVVSLMACSPSLEQIQFSAKKGAVLSQIAIICDNYRHNTCPIELIFYEHQETILAKLTFGHRAGSQVVDPGPYEPTTPSISVLEWSIDHVHESMQDICAQVLDSISSEALFFLTSFTLDISSLTVQGLVHVCNAQSGLLSSISMSTVCPSCPF